METNEITFQDFISLAGLTYSVGRISHRGDGLDSDWPSDARHFQVIIRCHGQSFAVEFSQGSAHKKDPELAEVLYCLRSDCDVVNYGDFEDWADCMGYDTDSRRAERIYNACVDTSDAMEHLLGEHWDQFLECVEE